MATTTHSGEDGENSRLLEADEMESNPSEASTPGEEVIVCPEKLPRRLICEFREDGRINSNSKPSYLRELVEVLHKKTDVYNRILDSCFGKLFKLPVRKCSLAGRVVHTLITRQLATKKKHEMWFLFGGKPIWFSLREFGLLTGLPFQPYNEEEKVRRACDTPLPNDGQNPYWDELIGKNKDPDLDEIVDWLKRLKMTDERRLRLALVVIVEGVLNCGLIPGKPTKAIVEKVRDVDEFLNYPWGRDCFEKTLEMITVSDKVTKRSSLVKKCLQSHITVHGFPLAIQLLAFKAIPSLKQKLPSAEDERTFTDRSIRHLAQLRTFHYKFMEEAETAKDVRTT